MRTLTVGDIQGNFKALRQVLDRSKFDYEKDNLIVLGDICDGYPETKECIDELLKIKNKTIIMGNHDWWLLSWFWNDNNVPDLWVKQGGANTLRSYGVDPDMLWKIPRTRPPIPKDHYDLLMSSEFYVIENNKLFVHGGFDWTSKEEHWDCDFLMWDRSLVNCALKYSIRKKDYKFGGFDEVYVGHTGTTYIAKTTKPVKFCNVQMMDTGAGWDGVLTIMDIDSKEYWQSDCAHDLYPGVMPRIGMTASGLSTVGE